MTVDTSYNLLSRGKALVHDEVVLNLLLHDAIPLRDYQLWTQDQGYFAFTPETKAGRQDLGEESPFNKDIDLVPSISQPPRWLLSGWERSSSESSSGEIAGQQQHEFFTFQPGGLDDGSAYG
jgi:hypothetical protein